MRNMGKLKDLNQLPVLKKNTLSNRLDDIITQKKGTSKWSTSGTSGKKIICLKNSTDKAYHYAFKYRFNSWFRIKPKDKGILLWRRTNEFKQNYLNRFREVIKDKLLNTTRISPVIMDQNKMNFILSLLSDKNIKYIRGYSGSILYLAQFVKNNNISLKFDRLKAIVSTGETLLNNQKNFINNVFNTNIANEYGACESGIIATDCEYGSLHIINDNVLVEILDDKGNHTESKGRIIVTALNSFATPIIRYEIGDYGKMSNRKCDCGRSFPIMDYIEGRIFDYIELPNNEKINIVGIFIFKILENMPKEFNHILNFQIEQVSMKKIIFKILSKSDNTEILDYIENSIRRYIGYNINIEVKFVNKFDVSQGKHRLLLKYMDKDL